MKFLEAIKFMSKAFTLKELKLTFSKENRKKGNFKGLFTTKNASSSLLKLWWVVINPILLSIIFITLYLEKGGSIYAVLSSLGINIITIYIALLLVETLFRKYKSEFDNQITKAFKNYQTLLEYDKQSTKDSNPTSESPK